MLPGEISKTETENSRKDSVLEMAYYYKNFNSFHRNYRKMVLKALQTTIVTFKQNLRVINNRINYYQARPNTKKRKEQEPKTFNHFNSTSKYNWGVRRQLSKETIYGKRILNGEEYRVERDLLDEKFNRAKVYKITDKGIQRILINHLEQFDTAKLSFEESIDYLNELLETEEFETIITNNEN